MTEKRVNMSKVVHTRLTSQIFLFNFFMKLNYGKFSERYSFFSFEFILGPSPLTLGMSDVVPIAVAFQEVCHAMFNGSEESRCQTRLIGK